MENTIKQQQLDLFSDRTSASRFAANQLRLLFSAFASILFHAPRRMLHGTRLARATAATLRLKPPQDRCPRHRLGTPGQGRHGLPAHPSAAAFARVHARLRGVASPPTPDFRLFPGTTAPQRQPGPFTQPRSCRRAAPTAAAGLLHPSINVDQRSTRPILPPTTALRRRMRNAG